MGSCRLGYILARKKTHKVGIGKMEKRQKGKKVIISKPHINPFMHALQHLVGQSVELMLRQR